MVRILHLWMILYLTCMLAVYKLKALYSIGRVLTNSLAISSPFMLLVSNWSQSTNMNLCSLSARCSCKFCLVGNASIWSFNILYKKSLLSPLCLHNVRPCGFSTFFSIFVATHVTAHDLRVNPLNEFTKMQPYSHESIPITKKSILIRIKIQAQSSTEDKAAISQGDATIL